MRTGMEGRSKVLLVVSSSVELSRWLVDRLTPAGLGWRGKPLCPPLGGDLRLLPATLEALLEGEERQALVVESSAERLISHLPALEGRKVLALVLVGDFSPPRELKAPLFVLSEEGRGLDELIFYLRGLCPREGEVRLEGVEGLEGLRGGVGSDLRPSFALGLLAPSLVLASLVLSHLVGEALRLPLGLAFRRLFLALWGLLPNLSPSSPLHGFLFGEVYEASLPGLEVLPSVAGALYYGASFLPRAVVFLSLFWFLEGFRPFRLSLISLDRLSHALGLHWYQLKRLLKSAGCRLCSGPCALELSFQAACSRSIPCLSQQLLLLLYPWGGISRMVLAFLSLLASSLALGLLCGLMASAFKPLESHVGRRPSEGFLFDLRVMLRGEAILLLSMGLCALALRFLGVPLLPLSLLARPLLIGSVGGVFAPEAAVVAGAALLPCPLALLRPSGKGLDLVGLLASALQALVALSLYVLGSALVG